MPTARQRSTRDRPAKLPLSEAAIVDAALSILATDGLDAVTMRRVAAALETGPASLYVYVSGREALLHAMQDRINATITLEPIRPRSWRRQLLGLLERMRQALIDHPGIAFAAIAEPPLTESTLRQFENLLGLLAAGGVEMQDAAWAADVLAMMVTYSAIESDVRRLDDQQLTASVSHRFAELSPLQFPLLTANVSALTSGTSIERFRFGVNVFLDGVLARRSSVS